MPVFRGGSSPSAWASTMTEWFEGAVLTGGEVWHVNRLARLIPGAFEIIVPGEGEGAQ